MAYWQKRSNLHTRRRQDTQSSHYKLLMEKGPSITQEAGSVPTASLDIAVGRFDGKF
jgi:hypothetical protein